ncbi:MAG: SH3 domain-containing protein [Actinomycetota bacterium]
MAFRFARYESATADAGGPAPGTVALKRYTLARWPQARSQGIYAPRTIRGSNTKLSHHAEGRALDIGLPTLNGGRAADTDQGMPVLEALLANARRLGIDHLIYNRRFWSARHPSGRSYTGVHPHYDHIHVGMTRAAGRTLNLATVIDVLGPIPGAEPDDDNGSTPTTFPATERATDRVSVEALRLRADPGLDATIIARLPRGAGVVRLDDEPQTIGKHTWVKVRVRDGESAVDGWVADGFLHPTGWKPDAGTDVVKSTRSITHRVNASGLRLRSEPTTSAAILTELPRGTGVERLDDQLAEASNHSWIHVRAMIGDRPVDGWVATTYLDEVTHVVTAPSGLRLRTSPTTSADIVIDLTDGSDVIQLTGTPRAADGHDWVKVRAHLGERTETGWVAAEYLTEQA